MHGLTVATIMNEMRAIRQELCVLQKTARPSFGTPGAISGDVWRRMCVLWRLKDRWTASRWEMLFERRQDKKSKLAWCGRTISVLQEQKTPTGGHGETERDLMIEPKQESPSLVQVSRGQQQPTSDCPGAAKRDPSDRTSNPNNTNQVTSKDVKTLFATD